MSFVRKGLTGGTLTGRRPIREAKLVATGVQRDPLGLILELSHAARVESSEDLQTWTDEGIWMPGEHFVPIVPGTPRKFFRARIPWVTVHP